MVGLSSSAVLSWGVWYLCYSCGVGSVGVAGCGGLVWLGLGFCRRLRVGGAVPVWLLGFACVCVCLMTLVFDALLCRLVGVGCYNIGSVW